MKTAKYFFFSIVILLLGLMGTRSSAQSWTSIDGGANGISSMNSLNSVFPSVAVFNGEIYAIWQEKKETFLFELHVMKYNGSTWTPAGNTAGSSLLYSSVSSVMFPKIVCYNNAIYAAWSGFDEGLNVVRVKKYDGSSWTFAESYTIGDGRTNINNGITANSKDIDLCVFNNELYAIWLEQDHAVEGGGRGIYQVRISKFNGTVWTSIDGNGGFGINYSQDQLAYLPTLCSYNNAIYAAWQENTSTNISQLRVKRYDGGSTWTFVDGGGPNGLSYNINEQLGDPMSLCSYNGKMYLFWIEDYTVRAKQYDGTTWSTDVDGGSGWNHDAAYGAFYPFCYAYDKLYVTWEQNPVPRQVRVASYDGTTKSFIDGDVPGIGINYTTANRAHYPKLTEYNGDLVAVWSEENSSTSDSPNQIRAKKYSLPSFVSSVTVPANGTYSSGQTLSFTVNFNKTLTVAGGTPYLTIALATGGTVNAIYTSGTGTTALTFSYTVAAGNADPDGISVGSAIVLPGGCTVRDASSVDAALTLNSVSSTTGVLVDGIAPTVLSINRQTPASTPTNATSLVYRVTFSESATGVGTSDFTLTTSDGATGGTIASVSSISGSIYDVTVNSLLGYGTFRLDLNSSGTGITDTPGNPISGGYTASQTYTNKYLPILSTKPVTAIGTTNATGILNISDLGYPNPTYGVCWGANANPTISDNTVTAGTASSTGDYSSLITGLSPITTYHLRVFATNNAGTSYGDDVSFTTSSTLTAPGNALNFDGANDYVSAGDVDNSLTAFTIEAWVNWTPSSAGDIQFICGKGVEQMEIHTGAGANDLRFIPTSGVYLDADNVLPTGVWTHVAVIYDPSVSLAKMYINGIEVPLVNNGTNPLFTGIANTSTPFYIGTRSDASYRFKGSIDEVRVWNTVRSQAEVQGDMVTDISSGSGLLCSYNFDEGTAGGNNTAGSTLLPDLTGNGNNGTLSNFALNGSTSNWVESYAMVLPVLADASGISPVGFTAGWTAPGTGTVESYLLEVASDAAFTNRVSGYAPKTIASPTVSEALTGLVAGTTYYYRVRADKTSLTNQGAWTAAKQVVLPSNTTFHTSGLWSNSGNWSAGIPGIDVDAVIAANCSVDTDASSKNLSINTGSVLTIAPNRILAVNGTLTNHAGVAGLVIDASSSGSGRLINNTSDLDATVKLYIVKDQWHYVSIPVNGISEMNDVFHNFYVLNNQESQDLDHAWAYLDEGVGLVRAKGYGVLWDRSHKPDEAGYTDLMVSFTGKLNSGEVQINTEFTSSERGWNFIGNPYPCTIDWNTGITKTNIGTAFYLWDPVTESYASYNGSVGTPVTQTQYLAPMQGFFVRADAANGSVVFTDAAKTDAASTFKSAAVQSIIRLTLSDTNGTADESVIRLHPNATEQFDGSLDAYKLKAVTSLTPQLYSVYKDIEYSINSLAEVTEKTVVPFELMIKKNGQHTLSLTELTGYNEALPIVLFNEAGQQLAYLQSANYHFTAKAGEVLKVKLAFNTVLASAEHLHNRFLRVAVDGSQLNISGLGQGQSAVHLFSIGGQLLQSHQVPGDALQIANLNRGVYLLRVKDSFGKQEVQKVIIY